MLEVNFACPYDKESWSEEGNLDEIFSDNLFESEEAYHFVL